MPEDGAASDEMQGMDDMAINDTHPGLVANGDVERLCAQYDQLLAEGVALDQRADAELRALARIFDLPCEGPANRLWLRVRGLVTKQLPAQDFEVDLVVEDFPMPRDALNILLVEDDPDAATALTEALDTAGHRVIGPFHSAEAAEAATALHQIDLALLDINLSGAATGIDLARSLKTSWGVPVIFISGDVSAAAKHADMASAMIIKPYSSADVVKAINSLNLPN